VRNDFARALVLGKTSCDFFVAMNYLLCSNGDRNYRLHGDNKKMVLTGPRAAWRGRRPDRERHLLEAQSSPTCEKDELTLAGAL